MGFPSNPKRGSRSIPLFVSFFFFSPFESRHLLESFHARLHARTTSRNETSCSRVSMFPRNNCSVVVASRVPSNSKRRKSKSEKRKLHGTRVKRVTIEKREVKEEGKRKRKEKEKATRGNLLGLVSRLSSLDRRAVEKHDQHLPRSLVFLEATHRERILEGRKTHSRLD